MPIKTQQQQHQQQVQKKPSLAVVATANAKQQQQQTTATAAAAADSQVLNKQIRESLQQLSIDKKDWRNILQQATLVGLSQIASSAASAAAVAASQPQQQQPSSDSKQQQQSCSKQSARLTTSVAVMTTSLPPPTAVTQKPGVAAAAFHRKPSGKWRLGDNCSMQEALEFKNFEASSSQKKQQDEKNITVLEDIIKEATEQPQQQQQTQKSSSSGDYASFAANFQSFLNAASTEASSQQQKKKKRAEWKSPVKQLNSFENSEDEYENEEATPQPPTTQKQDQKTTLNINAKEFQQSKQIGQQPRIKTAIEEESKSQQQIWTTPAPTAPASVVQSVHVTHSTTTTSKPVHTVASNMKRPISAGNTVQRRRQQRQQQQRRPASAVRRSTSSASTAAVVPKFGLPYNVNKIESKIKDQVQCDQRYNKLLAKMRREQEEQLLQSQQLTASSLEASPGAPEPLVLTPRHHHDNDIGMVSSSSLSSRKTIATIVEDFLRNKYMQDFINTQDR